MKVIHVGEYVSGGIATYLRTLVNCQIKNKNIEEIIIFKSALNSEKLIFDSSKVKVICYDYRRSAKGVFDLLALWKQIVEMKPDVVHLHSTFAGLLRVKKLLRRVPFRIVYCAHGWAFTRDSIELKNQIFAMVERVLSRGCDNIINISESEQSAALDYGLPAKKMVAINNAIEIPKKLPSKSKMSGKLKVLFVGRFDRQKGVDILIDAARELQDIDFRLGGRSVVGGINFKDIKIPSNVELLGWLSTEQVATEMIRADAVIIPSRWEGFGLVALEAMKNQCAVLATDVGGLAEIVRANENGILFDADSKDAIVQTLKIQTRNNLNKLGKQAQKFVVENYDAREMERRVFYYCYL